nr:MAG TPA: hypothetical protein [Caudoviricetes sp.]
MIHPKTSHSNKRKYLGLKQNIENQNQPKSNTAWVFWRSIVGCILCVNIRLKFIKIHKKTP